MKVFLRIFVQRNCGVLALICFPGFSRYVGKKKTFILTTTRGLASPLINYSTGGSLGWKKKNKGVCLFVVVSLGSKTCLNRQSSKPKF